MGEEIKTLEKTYRKFLSLGLLLLLTGFALLIFKPLGRSPSLVMGALLFALSFIPLELAKRIARRMAIIAFRENRKT
jgi:lauroyl/myristoyl acyltransferase